MYFVACGVGKGEFGARFQNSPWAVTSAFVPMKSGAAYGWIDCNASTATCIGLVSKLAAVLVLGAAMTAMKFKGITSTIVVDEIPNGFLDPHSGSVADVPAVSPSNTVFVLFTSGFSGEPKGAPSQHFFMVSSSHIHGKAQWVGPNTKVYQICGIHFRRYHR